MAINLGVPNKLLKEFLNRKLTVESSTGEVYKGILDDVEENMSMSLSEVKVTFADGNVVDMKSVYVKGSRIRLINLPDSAKDSLSSLTAFRSFRGGRGGRGGGRRGGYGGGGGGGGSSYGGKSYDRRRY